MKRFTVMAVSLMLLAASVLPAACAEASIAAGAAEYRYQRFAAMSPGEIVSEMTLAQKAAQMVQPILYRANMSGMRANCYGSIYGDEGKLDAASWRRRVDMYQQGAIASESGIPFMLAQDDVHGVGYCMNAVYFPQNG